jgi:hypothetical protein
MSDCELVEALNKFISSYPKKIDKKDFIEAIKTVYSSKKQTKKNDNSDKPKRAPTEYNLFMCAEMEKLKNEGIQLNGKEKMELIAKKWKEHKGCKEEEIKNEEVKEEEIKKEEVKEEEIKKEEEVKKEGKKKEGKK